MTVETFPEDFCDKCATYKPCNCDEKPIYALADPFKKIKFIREASVVNRCHTVPHFGDYPVGLHSYNMMAMLRILYPDAPVGLIWAILAHDVPERLTGDIPAPVKWFAIVDRDQLVIAETAINFVVFDADMEGSLTQDEQKWLKGLDILELYMWCRDQLMLGNRNVNRMITRIDKFIIKNMHLFAKEVIDLYFVSKNDSWEMMPDLGELE